MKKIIILILLVLISCKVKTAEQKLKENQSIELNLKVEFLLQYFDKKEACVCIIKYAEKYNLDWKKMAGMLLIESDGKQFARGRYKEKGYSQLMRRTAKWLKYVLRNEYQNPNTYDIEFNINAGALFLRSLLDYSKENYNKAIELYNVGYGNYWKGKRNKWHVQKWLIQVTHLNYEWEKYNE